MRVAKAKGHLRGKQPKLSPRQEAHLVELISSAEYTTSEVGDLFGVARSTVYRAVQRSEQRAAKAATPPARTTCVRARAQRAIPDAPAAQDAADVATDYRPRHSVSEFPPVKRAARTPRRQRPEPTRQTGR